MSSRTFTRPVDQKLFRHRAAHVHLSRPGFAGVRFSCRKVSGEDLTPSRMFPGGDGDSAVVVDGGGQAPHLSGAGALRHADLTFRDRRGTEGREDVQEEDRFSGRERDRAQTELLARGRIGLDEHRQALRKRALRDEEVRVGGRGANGGREGEHERVDRDERRTAKEGELDRLGGTRAVDDAGADRRNLLGVVGAHEEPPGEAAEVRGRRDDPRRAGAREGRVHDPAGRRHADEFVRLLAGEHGERQRLVVREIELRFPRARDSGADGDEHVGVVADLASGADREDAGRKYENESEAFLRHGKASLGSVRRDSIASRISAYARRASRSGESFTKAPPGWTCRTTPLRSMSSDADVQPLSARSSQRRRRTFHSSSTATGNENPYLRATLRTCSTVVARGPGFGV